jgi:molybdopterin biosynthesis enzyme MoaB
VRDDTLIINLPGSPKAVRENLAVVLPVLEHALELLAGERPH